jgi:hypothetical protein
MQNFFHAGIETAKNFAEPGCGPLGAERGDSGRSENKNAFF